MKRIVMLVAIAGFLPFARSGHAANQFSEVGDEKKPVLDKPVLEKEKPGGRSELDARPHGRPPARPLPPRAAPQGVSEEDRKFAIRGQRSSWSPDGKKITFDLRLRSETEICVIDAEVIQRLPTFKMALPADTAPATGQNQALKGD